jgi:hypothetical protein
MRDGLDSREEEASLLLGWGVDGFRELKFLAAIFVGNGVLQEERLPAATGVGRDCTGGGGGRYCPKRLSDRKHRGRRRD